MSAAALTEAALTEAALGRLVGTLTSRPGPVPKYSYPSAGTLYPVQTYVILRWALGALQAGSYYHDPDAHALVRVSDDIPVAPDGTDTGALLILVAQLMAIEPIYGARASDFCMLEAGYMREALETAADGLILRDAGDPAGHAVLTAALALESGHLPLVCWAVGEGG